MHRVAMAVLLLAPALASAAPEKGGGKKKSAGFDPVWSVGGHVGTSVLPGAYPLGFPPKISEYDFDEDDDADDVDGDGEPDATTLEKVRGDVLVGVEGFYWLNAGARLGVTLDLDVGSHFSQYQAIFLVDGTSDTGSLFVVYGGGAGFGQTSLTGTDPDEKLSLPNFPLRAEFGALIPATDQIGIEGRLFGQVNVPSRHAYTDIAGNEQDVGGVPFSYLLFGLQLGVAFGEYD